MLETSERRTLRLHLLVALLAGLVGCHATEPPPIPDPLPTNEPVERAITGNEVHFYELTANAGEYFSADVEQLDVDLVAKLLDPDGVEILKVDNLTGATGKESLFAIAPTSGDYRLEIKTYRSFEAGRYRVGGTLPHAPSENERVLAEASKLQYRTWPPNSSDEAEKRLLQAFNLWQSASQPRQAALTLERLGILCASTDGEMAMNYFQQALELLEANGYGDETAPLENRLAQLWRDSTPVEVITRHLTRAIETARAVHDRNEEGVALNGLAVASKARGKPWEALSYFDQSLKIWAKLGNGVSEATALFNIGSVYGLLGKSRDSADAYQQALDLYRLNGRKTRQADVLTAIAGVHIEEGELQTAEEELEQALELIHQFETGSGGATPETRALRVKVLERLGTVRLEKDETAAAESTYESALALARENSSQILVAIVLNNLGSLHDRGDEPDRGLAAHEEALRIFAKMGERIGESYTRFLIARSKLHLGDLLGAKAAIETALSVTEDVRFASKSIELRQSYFASIRDRFELFVEILMKLHSVDPNHGYDVQAFEASERGRARSLLDLLSESQGRRRLAGRIDASEQSLEDQIHTIQNQLDGTAAAPPEIDRAGREKELARLILEFDRVKTLSHASGDAARQLASVLTLPEIQKQVIDDDKTLLLSYNLGDERSYLTVVSRRDLAAYELPGRRRIESAALQFHNCLSTSHNFSVRAQMVHAAQGLGKMLLGPIASQLTDQRLLIVSEGALQYIPFAALELPSSDSGARSVDPAPLITRHEIVNIPSASILAALRKASASRQPAAKLLAVLADPVFGLDDPRFQPGPVPEAAVASLERGVKRPEEMGYQRLPWSLREAEAILNLVSPEQRFQALGFDANREVVTGGRLHDFRILHFATHGQLYADHPELSSLVLSCYDTQGKRRDGFVRMHEIPDLDLPAELVVLSACRTALGKAVLGEGLVGLTQAFLSAGATRLVVSLWDVNDRGTADLMTAFYRGMLHDGLAPAAALRAAQLSMIEKPDWNSPYYWAPFVIEGEWRGLK